MPHSYLYTDECKRNIEREVPNLTNNLKVRADAPALAMVQSMNNTYQNLIRTYCQNVSLVDVLA